MNHIELWDAKLAWYSLWLTMPSLFAEQMFLVASAVLWLSLNWIRLHCTFICVWLPNHVWSKAMHNVSAHQLPWHYQSKWVPSMAITALVKRVPSMAITALVKWVPSMAITAFGQVGTFHGYNCFGQVSTYYGLNCFGQVSTKIL